MLICIYLIGTITGLLLGVIITSIMVLPICKARLKKFRIQQKHRVSDWIMRWRESTSNYLDRLEKKLNKVQAEKEKLMLFIKSFIEKEMQPEEINIIDLKKGIDYRYITAPILKLSA
jgi:vacuolar-type H+-ATPase catalytic subunit A/Vma1